MNESKHLANSCRRFAAADQKLQEAFAAEDEFVERAAKEYLEARREHQQTIELAEAALKEEE